MKRTSIFYFSLAAIATGSFISCQDYNPFDESTLQHLNAQKAFEATLNEYTKNFEDRFGKIDPNHTWGFGTILGESNSNTRANVAEKNMWVNQYHMQVPGQPDIWTDNSGGKHQGYDGKPYHNVEIQGTNEYSTEAGNEPAGDVTDEEIAYVSWWFRTHRYPQSLNVHWTDFYLQEISADNDRKANGDIVSGYSAIEIEAENNLSLVGSWRVNKYQEVDKYTIDQLKVLTKDPTYGTYSDGYDHINNFNSGHANTLFDFNNLSTSIQSDGSYGWEDLETLKDRTSKRLIAFYQSSGTEDWAAHYSNDGRWRDNYVDKQIWSMVHLHFIGKSGRVYDGYYLGFDYAFHTITNPEDPTKYQIRKPDGYYSNWIVKVSPGVPIVPDDPTVGFTKRIMCEDLGNTYDLDFDDVVFDVTLNATQGQLDAYKNNEIVPVGGFDATVTLLAAGGTMPIWVGKDPGKNLKADYEAHDLFHVSRTTPVNVANGADAPIANYHITLSKPDFDEVGIWVYNTGNSTWYELPKSVQKFQYEGPGYDDSKERAPQKFAVPPTVLWLKETRQIESSYEKFAKWVTNPVVEEGDVLTYKFTEDGVTSEKNWYEYIKNKENLCGTIAETPASTAPTPGQINDSGIVGTTSSWSTVNTYDVIPFVNNKEWGTLTVTGGTYNKYTDGYTFSTGQIATLVPEAKSGYEFWKWEQCAGSSTITDNKLKVSGMEYVFAYFKPCGYDPDKTYPFSQTSDYQTLKVNDEFNFSCYFNGITNAHLSSDNNEIVAFSHDTVLRCKKQGTAVVTLVYDGDGSHNSGKLTLHITVQ